jgi:hypothetical protein
MRRIVADACFFLLKMPIADLLEYSVFQGFLQSVWSFQIHGSAKNFS